MNNLGLTVRNTFDHSCSMWIAPISEVELSMAIDNCTLLATENCTHRGSPREGSGATPTGAPAAGLGPLMPPPSRSGVLGSDRSRGGRMDRLGEFGVAAQPVAVAPDVDDVAPVQDPVQKRRLPARCSNLSEEKLDPAGRRRGQMQNLRGPREIRPNLAGGGWLVEFSLDGKPLRAVVVSTDDEAHDVAQEYVDTGQDDRDTIVGWIAQFFAVRSTTCGKMIRWNPRSRPEIPLLRVLPSNIPGGDTGNDPSSGPPSPSRER